VDIGGLDYPPFSYTPRDNRNDRNINIGVESKGGNYWSLRNNSPFVLILHLEKNQASIGSYPIKLIDLYSMIKYWDLLRPSV
jgi:hypothetical protein